MANSHGLGEMSSPALRWHFIFSGFTDGDGDGLELRPAASCPGLMGRWLVEWWLSAGSSHRLFSYPLGTRRLCLAMSLHPLRWALVASFLLPVPAVLGPWGTSSSRSSAEFWQLAALPSRQVFISCSSFSSLPLSGACLLPSSRLFCISFSISILLDRESVSITSSHPRVIES